MLVNRFFLPCLIILFAITACEPEEEDEVIPEEEEVQHQSVLVANSGWKSYSFDDEIFYPYGGFSGYQNIDLLNSFVFDGKPHVIVSYEKQYATGSYQDLIQVSESKIERIPSIKINSHKSYFKKEGDLYSYLITENHEVDLARINGPDFTTYNSFLYDLDQIRNRLSAANFTFSSIYNHGELEMMVENNEPHIVNCIHAVIRDNSTSLAEKRLVMASKNISRNVGAIERIGILPSNSLIDQEAYISMQSKSIGNVVMSVAVLTHAKKGLFVFGDFTSGFNYIQTTDNVRGVYDFFTGPNYFYCILEQYGNGDKLAFKIDANGNITDLGTVTDVYEGGFTHFQGELVAAINEDVGGSKPKIYVQKITSNRRENLGSENLTNGTAITHLMSDGNHLFAATVNRSSPKYQGGGRQFHGWEFMVFED